MSKGLTIFLLVGWLLQMTCEAQVIERCRQVRVQKEFFFLDSLTALPATLYVPALPALRLRYDMQTRKAQFLGDLPAQDSLLLCYKVLPTQLAQWAGKRDRRIIDTTDTYWLKLLEKIQQYTPPREQIADVLKDFQKSGSYVRGLALGNTQNVFVNSALNLQLEGKITDDITVTASISDQEVPYQPEGNTLQLQQIDQIFVRFSHKNGNITGGNIVLKHQENHFLKFYKNTQGALLETAYKVGKTNAQTFAGFAAARGKFYSATIQPVEGVQGPYRLRGANGELFIIILANSEKVFIDGQPLKRGAEYDYIIDYNLGEIIFNNQILITRFTRIRVDYEYAETNYNRSILTVGHAQSTKKWRVLSQIYREGDSKSNGIVPLSDSAKAELRTQVAGIGLVNGIENKGFDPNEVRYKRIDSTNLAGTFPQILVYSTQESVAIYRAFFTQVGKGQGDYVRERSTVNGQIYRWVQPINGIKQGDYAPLKAVPLPNSKQLWATTASYKLTENEQITADFALSQQRTNLFSTLPTATLSGWGLRVGYQNVGKAGKDSARYVGFGSLFAEYNQANFTPIDRFRSIEFDRDWNKNIDSSRLADRIMQAEIGMKNLKNGYLVYKINLRDRENQVRGWQQIGEVLHQTKRVILQGNAFFLQSAPDSSRAVWARWQASLTYKTRYIVPSYRWEGDKNTLTQRDSITQSLMHFSGHTFTVRNADSLKWKYSLAYQLRQDQAPLEGKMQNFLSAETVTFQTSYQSPKERTFALTAVYRKATLSEQFRQGNSQGENLQGRLDWFGKYQFFRKIKTDRDSIKVPHPILSTQQNLFLATSTGQELQREYYFILVPVGQGTHTWRDDNANTIKELNEFYPAINPDERQYAKIFRPTNTYIPAFTQQLEYYVNWRTHNPRKGRVQGKLSGALTWKMMRRFTENNLFARFLPFVALGDSSILAENRGLVKKIFFNQNAIDYAGDIIYQNTTQKQLLTNGFEQRGRQDIKTSWRQRLTAKWNLQGFLSVLWVDNSSDFLQNRNFRVRAYQLSPELAYQANVTQRVSLSYLFSQKTGNNAGESALPAQIHELKIEGSWTKLSKRVIKFQGRFLNIGYAGEQNSPLAYEMLEALRVGTNFTWNVNWQERLQNGLQLSFIYEGRKSPNTPLINIGRAQVGVLF